MVKETFPVELFDVVDEHDNVINTLSREEVHRNRLRHRAVHIFVQRSDGALLIHLRAADKEEFPSVWTSSASGHVSAGEDYATAAERELLEELGLRGSLQRFARFRACPDTSNEFTELYVSTSEEPVTFDPAEIVEIRWVQPAVLERELEAEPEKFSPAFRLLFKAWRSDEDSVRD